MNKTIKKEIMIKALKDFFTFEKRGLNGIVALIVILCLQMITLWLLNFYNPHETVKPNFVKVNPALLDSLDRNSKRTAESVSFDAYNDDVVNIHKNKKVGSRFIFNPNTVTDIQWLALGLSKSQVKSIRKYIDRGGKFTKPSDVLKIRVVNQETWQELIPYIEITQVAAKSPAEQSSNDTNGISIVHHEKSQKEKLIELRKNLIFDFNTCNRYNLKGLDLLDSLTIEKLMRYKQALGGFVALSQLYETEGIDTNNFTKLKTHLTLDLMSVKTININTCSSSQLSKHPYISYNLAVALVNYRQTHGKYEQFSDLKKCLAMNEQLLKKITPYLRLSDD